MGCLLLEKRPSRSSGLSTSWEFGFAWLGETNSAMHIQFWEHQPPKVICGCISHASILVLKFSLMQLSTIRGVVVAQW